MTETDLDAAISSSVPRRVYTVGHVHHPMEHYLELLRQHDVGVVVDVRSQPYSRHATQFNRENLQSALQDAGLAYEYLGERLGGKPEGHEFYDDEGYTLFEPLSQQRWFLKDIGRIEYRAENETVALTCLEEEPERCHRYHLLGKVLSQRGAQVIHIRRDGRLHTQNDISQHLGEGQGSLLDEPPVWRSAQPMRDGHGVFVEEDFEPY